MYDVRLLSSFLLALALGVGACGEDGDLNDSQGTLRRGHNVDGSVDDDGSVDSDEAAEEDESGDGDEGSDERARLDGGKRGRGRGDGGCDFGRGFGRGRHGGGFGSGGHGGGDFDGFPGVIDGGFKGGRR